jgi:Ca2+-transporting ATPase
MAAGTLAVLTLAPGPDAAAGRATVAGTMAFTTFVLFQAFNLLNVRSRETTVFSRRTLSNRALWISLAAILVLQVAAVQVPALQGFFDTTSLTAGEWGVTVAVASSVLWIEEIRKAVSRARHRA